MKRFRIRRTALLALAMAFLAVAWVWDGFIAIERFVVGLIPWTRFKHAFAALVDRLPAPFARFDMATIGLSAVALALWAALPFGRPTVVALAAVHRPRRAVGPLASDAGLLLAREGAESSTTATASPRRACPLRSPARPAGCCPRGCTAGTRGPWPTARPEAGLC